MTTTASAPVATPAAITKRWIIRGDHRRCQNYHCTGYDSRKAKVKLHPDGKIDITCNVCDTKFDGKCDTFKERRPCERCQWKRDVIVRLYFEANGTPNGERAEKHCSICLMELSAARHEATAREFRQRARRLTLERQRKSGG